jgi:hypothetical protein
VGEQVGEEVAALREFPAEGVHEDEEVDAGSHGEEGRRRPET